MIRIYEFGLVGEMVMVEMVGMVGTGVIVPDEVQGGLGARIEKAL